MRRTSFMVLVLAALFVTSATGLSALPARAHHAHTAAKAAVGKRTDRARSTATQRRTAHGTAHATRHAAAHGTRFPAKHAIVRRTSTSILRRHSVAAEDPDTNSEASTRARQPPAENSPDRERKPHSTEAIAQDSASLDEAEPSPDQAPETVPSPVAEVASLTPIPAIMPPPMRGSLASLQRQNQRSEAEGLERIANERDLASRIAHKLLVPVPASAALTINQDLPLHHRYCRPWTARFLADLAQAHAAIFHGPVEVSSAVRTVDYQKRLMTVNGNAAAAEGQIVSPHLTGATIDIAKSAMSQREIGWMRSWLTPLQSAGLIDVEEEFQQACFHITVYGNYVQAGSPATMAHAGSKRNRRSGGPRQKAAQPKGRQDNSGTDNSTPDTADATDGTATLGR